MIIKEPVEIERRAVFQDRIADYYGHRCRFVEHSLWISFLCRQAFPRRHFSRDFCDSKSPVIIDEFLPLLTRELESSTDSFDRIVTLAAFGSLGVEEIVPVLLPVICGTPGQFDDTAERVRTILSLHRVVFAAPEKV